MVGYDEQRPVAALTPLVSSVWVQQVAADAPTCRHRNLPNGSVELRCRIGSAPQVVGPLTGPLVEELPPGTTVVGLRLRPGAAAGLLGLPAAELVDQVVDVGELFGTAVSAALGERLATASTPLAALAALQHQVVDRLTETPAPDGVVLEAVRRLMPGRAGTVADVRSSLEISERQLRRRCLTAVGIAPKALHRVLRFQGFLALTQFALARGRDPSGEGLASMAAAAGYADQAHLTRECLRLTGVTPRAFVGDTSRHCGCGHDHAASYEQLLPSNAMAVLFKNTG